MLKAQLNPEFLNNEEDRFISNFVQRRDMFELPRQKKLHSHIQNIFFVQKFKPSTIRLNKHILPIVF